MKNFLWKKTAKKKNDLWHKEIFSCVAISDEIRKMNITNESTGNGVKE